MRQSLTMMKKTSVDILETHLLEKINAAKVSKVPRKNKQSEIMGEKNFKNIHGKKTDNA